MILFCMLDVQSRSMRDNLLFFNFDELPIPRDRASEDCSQTIFNFMTTDLELSNVTDIKIDRAHRIGNFQNGKKRPIVVKFNYHQDKMLVKKSAFDKLKDSNYRVSDQYPKEIQERRRKLIPVLIQAKNDNKRAVLSYDKLYIDGVLYKPDASPI